MSLSCARSTGPAVLGLLAAILLSVLAPGPTRAGALPTASAGGSAPLSLAGQSPWVTPTPPGSPKTFTLDLKAGPATPASDEVVATLYTVLKTRSAFEQTLKAAPTGTVLDHTHAVALSAMPATGGARSLAVAVLPGPTASPAPSAGTPTLDLHCVGTGTCTGVYPVVVSLLRPLGGGRTAAVPHSSFTTYLTYSAVKSATPLGFTWVAPVAAPVAISSGRVGAPSVEPPDPATAEALEGLAATLANRPTVPVTLAASPQTLQALAAEGPKGAQAVSRLAAMSTADPTTRQFLPETYVPVDLGALGAAGEGEEITAQDDLGTSVLRSLGITASAHSGTWVATGTVGTALRPAMTRVGDDRLVLPDADLAPSRTVEGTWASAFALPLGRGAPIEAAPSDGQLAQHFTADPSDPALEANQLLADLAMIHFEAPNTGTPRAVVAVPPAGWVPNRAFDAELLAGLATDPVVRATTLNAYFSTFSDASGASAPSRHLASGGPGPALPASLARHLTTSRLHLTAFDAAVTGAPRVKTQLDELLLAAESSDLSSEDMAAGVRSFGTALGAQLSQVQLATQRTVTLTARTGLIPVTILSSAGYTVVGTLVLSGGRFVFPRGNTRRLTLDHPTNPTRFDIEARTSGDLPMLVTFRSPTGSLVIASGQLTIRSTATSFAGVVLSALALLVLGGWWARTWWSGRRRRRAEQEPG